MPTGPVVEAIGLLENILNPMKAKIKITIMVPSFLFIPLFYHGLMVYSKRIRSYLERR